MKSFVTGRNKDSDQIWETETGVNESLQLTHAGGCRCLHTYGGSIFNLAILSRADKVCQFEWICTISKAITAFLSPT